jgi:hypothetical protein
MTAHRHLVAPEGLASDRSTCVTSEAAECSALLADLCARAGTLWQGTHMRRRQRVVEAAATTPQPLCPHEQEEDQRCPQAAIRTLSLGNPLWHLWMKPQQQAREAVIDAGLIISHEVGYLLPRQLHR